MNMFNLENMINPELKELIDQKINSFVDYIYSIVNEDRKNELEDEMTTLKTNYMKILMFIMFLKKENMNENIHEFMQKYDIDPVNYYKIEEYYDFFIEMKELFMKGKKD